MEIKKLTPFIFLVLLLLNITCNKTGMNSGHLVLSITDKPYPVGIMESVDITISQIDLKFSNSGDFDNPFITLFDKAVTVNLLELTNGNTYELYNDDISSGYYDLLKIYFSSAIITLKDGSVWDCDINDEVINGFEVYFDNAINLDKTDTNNILIDFDVSKSFIPLGNIENPVSFSGFRFRPVINTVELEFTGSLSGIITNDTGETISDATISLLYNKINYSTTFSDDYGNYKFIGVVENRYSVLVEADGYTAQTVDNVQVKKNKNTELNFVLLPE